LEPLLGKQLHTVTFTKEGIKLGFLDTAELGMKRWPVVVTTTKEFKHSHPRYLDRLCAMIGDTVTEINCVQSQTLQLRLGLRATITLTIDPTDRVLAHSEVITYRDKVMKYHFINGLSLPTASFKLESRNVG
jgi:hypothetical protein